MSNSSLVQYTDISPNRSSPRSNAINRVTIHCVVGQASMQSLGNVFKPSSAQSSSNYGCCIDGIAMYVEEKDRSWCSSNAENDNRAITIEVSSDSTYPYAVRDDVMERLYCLLVDIVKRNPGLGGKLTWRDDKNNPGNMTVHRWYANKSCPGEFLFTRMGAIADEVNRRLSGNAHVETPTPVPTPQLKSTSEVAREVIAGAWGNGNERKSALINAGYDYATIQAEVNRLVSPTEEAPTPAPTPQLKSTSEVAREVIAGSWGNGSDRQTALTNAGYDYATIQAEVDRLLTPGGSAPQLKSTSEVAREVIAGAWGNGNERKTALTNAGYDYATIQAEVNRLLS